MDIGRITSRQNRLVREAAALAADGEKRREKGLFLCEGARLCQDAARSGVGVEICFFTPQARERYRAYVEPVLACCREAYEIEDHVAALLSATRHTQGVFCLCRWPQGLAGGELPLDGSPCLVLEQLQDPGNLGTVLRTAEALGVDQVYLLGDCCDPLSPKALRASMGAAFRVRLAAEASPQWLCGLLRERGYQLHAAVPHRDAAPITAIDFAAGAHAVFVGNEGAGLREETIALCRSRVTIPMAGRAESLNASAAATILLWEMTRGGVRHG